MPLPRLVTPPAELPVPLALAKEHIEVDFADRDLLIDGFLRAATARLDGYAGLLGRCLVSQDWQQDYACWRDLRLPLPDVQAVRIDYVDEAGAGQTVEDTGFELVDEAAGPTIRFARGWPPPRLARTEYPVRVTFTAGYGTADDVPWPIKGAILQHVATMFAYRETLADRAQPTGIYHELIAPYRRVRI